MSVVLLLNKWLLGLLLFNANVHPYHVSATEMEYDVKSQRVEISTKIFTDDFETVLSKIYKQRTDLANPELKTQMTVLVNKYITTHLTLKTGDKLLPLRLYDWEVDHEAVIIYTTAEATAFNVKNIRVENTMLYDLFDDQVNIVHFIYKGNRKSTKLVYPETRVLLSF